MIVTDTVAFYDTKPYDRKWFDAKKGRCGIELRYLENRLSADTAVLAAGCRAVVPFVNDLLDAPAIDRLCACGVRAAALRCAGLNNVDISYAAGRLKIYHVPAYSPAAVAEHAMALLLCLVRKIHKAYNRTREHNFSLRFLEGFDLKGKTAGIIGMGRVGRAFGEICAGFGMKVIAFDLAPDWGRGVEYVGLEELLRRADVISLHCPLTRQTYHLLDRHAFAAMKRGAHIINTSRGALIDSKALLEAIKSEKVGGAGLDVYEEETRFFYEDISGTVLQDDTLNMLLAQPNVLVTSHQAFLTDEALEAIAETTLRSLRAFLDGQDSPNEVTARAARPDHAGV